MSYEVVWRAGILYTMEPSVGLISYHKPARIIRKKIIQESCATQDSLFYVKEWYGSSYSGKEIQVFL